MAFVFLWTLVQFSIFAGRNCGGEICWQYWPSFSISLSDGFGQNPVSVKIISSNPHPEGGSYQLLALLFKACDYFGCYVSKLVKLVWTWENLTDNSNSSLNITYQQWMLLSSTRFKLNFLFRTVSFAIYFFTDVIFALILLQLLFLPIQ